jgi:hypothetical protein
MLYHNENLNKLIIAEKENLNHFSCKALMFYLLSELNHDLICDYNIIEIGNFDLYDLSTRTVYQFQDPHNPINELQQIKNDILLKNDVEVIIIHLEDLPDNIFQRYLKLKEYIFSD